MPAGPLLLQLVAGGIFVALLGLFRHRPLSLTTIVIWGLLFRVPFLFVIPVQTDDFYRYLHEGAVWWANPYLNPPASALFQGMHPGILARINHPELPAIYPPGAQFFFVSTTELFGMSVGGYKAALLLVELFALASLSLYIKAARLPATALALYAWNPLVICEGMGNGHFEPLLVGLMALALMAWRRGRPWLAGAAWGAAILVKLTPVLAVPLLFAHRLSTRRRAIRLALPLAVATIFLAYHARFLAAPPTESRTAFSGSLAAYAARWQANGVLFPLVERALDASGVAAWIERQTWGDTPAHRLLRAALLLHPEASHATQMAKALCALLLIGALAWLLLRHRLPGRARPPGSPESALLALTTALLFLSPVFYPWYTLLLFPMVLRRPRAWWIWLQVAAPLLYLTPPGAAGPTPLALAVVLPALLLLAVATCRTPRRDCLPVSVPAPS